MLKHTSVPTAILDSPTRAKVVFVIASSAAFVVAAVVRLPSRFLSCFLLSPELGSLHTGMTALEATRARRMDMLKWPRIAFNK